MTRKLSAAIFDLDGVLLDTEPLYTQATQKVLAKYGKSYDWSLKRFIMGRGPVQGARWLVERLDLPISVEQYLSERLIWLKELFAQCPIVAGAQDLVALLHERGVKLALATSSERELFELKIRPYLWFNYFQVSICGDDPRLMRSKPAPDIFLLAAAELDVHRDQCLVFEDSPAGVAAARAAGMCVIARLEPPVDRSDLDAADLVVSSYAELDLEQLVMGILPGGNA